MKKMVGVAIIEMIPRSCSCESAFGIINADINRQMERQNVTV